MRGFNIELEGLQRTLDKLKKEGRDVEAEVDAEIGSAVVDTERMASIRVPKSAIGGGAGLAGAISYKRNKSLDWEVVAQKHYAAYVEFGTGGLVDIPSGLEAYAAQFKGKGIKKVNLPARPYLFPSFVEARAKLIEELKRVLKKPR